MILLIDDDEFTLKLLNLQLCKLGFWGAKQFTSATDALQFLREAGQQVSLIFLDLQMPETDGIEVIRELKALNYDGDIVIASAEDKRLMRSAEKLAIAHGMKVLGVLEKPLTSNHIQVLLEIWAPSTIEAVKRQQEKLATISVSELKNALSDEEHLYNVYQPQVNLQTGEIVGIESLVRWEHPTKGLIFPDQFVPLAEEHGLIDDLLRITLKNALKAKLLWQQAGFDWMLSVNVSMDNLTNLDFPDIVRDTCSLYGIGLDRLTLEVTEGRLMRDPLAALDILSRLRLKGVRLSIDDFGTGHSSLAQLEDVPFDEMKLDKRFVQEADKNHSQEVIVRASIEMARTLNMSVMAEGIETESTWKLMKSLGVDAAQGFFVSRPLPTDKLLSWVEVWRERHRELAKL